jgi:hypothetical protein
MNRRIGTGVLAGVLAAATLFAVGAGGYRAGQRNDDSVTRVVSETDSGEVVRVVGDHDGFRPGGFFLFPLLLVILLVVLLGRGRGWGGGPFRRFGPGYGPPGYAYGQGAGHGPDDRASWFDEWHRRAHEAQGAERQSQTPQDEPPPSSAGPPPEDT